MVSLYFSCWSAFANSIFLISDDYCSLISFFAKVIKWQQVSLRFKTTTLARVIITSESPNEKFL